MRQRARSIEPRVVREPPGAPRPGPTSGVVMIEQGDEGEREARYQQAMTWLASGGGHSRWETLLTGVVRCTVTLGSETREAVGYGSLEVARQNALLHAVDELQDR